MWHLCVADYSHITGLWQFNTSASSNFLFYLPSASPETWLSSPLPQRADLRNLKEQLNWKSPSYISWSRCSPHNLHESRAANTYSSSSDSVVFLHSFLQLLRPNFENRAWNFKTHNYKSETFFVKTMYTFIKTQTLLYLIYNTFSNSQGLDYYKEVHREMANIHQGESNYITRSGLQTIEYMIYFSSSEIFI